MQGGTGLGLPPLFGERDRPLEPIFTLDPRPHTRAPIIVRASPLVSRGNRLTATSTPPTTSTTTSTISQVRSYQIYSLAERTLFRFLCLVWTRSPPQGWDRALRPLRTKFSIPRSQEARRTRRGRRRESSWCCSTLTGPGGSVGTTTTAGAGRDVYGGTGDTCNYN